MNATVHGKSFFVYGLLCGCNLLCGCGPKAAEPDQEALPTSVQVEDVRKTRERAPSADQIGRDDQEGGTAPDDNGAIPSARRPDVAANTGGADAEKPLALPGTEGPTECHGGDAFSCEVEILIHRMTNDLRRQEGVPPLAFGSRLGFAARKWSESQSERGDISHEGFPESRLNDLRAEFGEDPGATPRGENVAKVSTTRTLEPEEVARILVDSWWESPGHRENMLRDFDALGVGYFGVGGAHYATQLFGSEDGLDVNP